MYSCTILDNFVGNVIDWTVNVNKNILNVNMINYYNKVIVVVGLGLTGVSCVHFLLERGAIIRALDTRSKPPGLNNLPKSIDYYLGDLNIYHLLDADMIVVSPGIGLTNFLLNAVISANIEIVSDIELFCRETQVPIIAITGSNGKSTVTYLVNKMAQAAGIYVGVGGNFGLPALSLLNDLYELYILELSSFQLEYTFSMQPVIATILNVTENHMNRYPYGLHQYHAAKLRIYKNAKVCLINADDSMTTPKQGIDERCISFGINQGDYRLNYKCNETFLCAYGKNILNINKLLIFGRHNYLNILAALAIAETIGLSRSSNLEVLTKFKGLKHRLQLILNRNGVRWINDSKSTNINSTKVALSCVRTNGTIHLLLGGDGKSANFSSLIPYISNKKIRLYCFGQDRNKLAYLRPEISDQTETMEQSIHLLSSRLKYGDVVLLSPACASVDQFNNFEQRGNVFTFLAKKFG